MYANMDTSHNLAKQIISIECIGLDQDLSEGSVPHIVGPYYRGRLFLFVHMLFLGNDSMS